jgi:predicted RNA-binding protein (virulence factor B family)
MADKKTVKRQAPQQKQPGGPRRWISLLFYVLAFAFMGYYFFGDKEGQGLSKEVSYTNLTKYIEAGVIDKIEVKDDLMATAKVERYLEPLEEKQGLLHGDAVDCLIWQKTDLGFKAIINNKYQGQLYDNQIFQPLRTGDRVTAYIDHIRQDGKTDLTLQPTGRRHTLDFAEVLLRYLHENNGHCDLSDKSPAELIADRFKVSKKAYKKAIGDLYRRRLITITDEGIRLV